MLHTSHLKLAPILLAAITVLALPGCYRSREDMLKDRSALVERKLESERDRALAAQPAGVDTPNAPGRDQRLSHLQSLRLALSAVNVSIAAVPLMLPSFAERDVGYSILDEAVGTIDWNIPIYDSTNALRPYPSLFSPQAGLDFAAVRRGGTGNTPPGIAR